METKETTTEILVHITAPSTASDDVRYRALASAYLAFEPAHTVELPKEQPTAASQSSQNALISPQASFRSVWDNVNSPSLAMGKGQPEAQLDVQPHPQVVSQRGNGTQASWIAPPSEVPDSMPYNDISVPDFCTPTRVLNFYLQATEPADLDPGELMLGGDVAQTPPSPTTQPRASVAPVTGPTPGADVSLKSIQVTPLSRETIGGMTMVRSVPSSQVGERAESEPPSAKRPKKGPAREAAHILGKSTSDLLPRRRPDRGVNSQQTWPGKEKERGKEEDTGFENPDWSHVTQIISAEPLVSNHSLGPRPPVNLEALAKNMEMERRYQPSYQAREMRPYERGYWLTALDGWGQEEKVAFWGFLGNYLRQDGNAGWGTRACRDEEWRWVRLYGWEHIAGELYILLYVASYRRLKSMEMKFYDGAGDVLVIVGARCHQMTLG